MPGRILVALLLAGVASGCATNRSAWPSSTVETSVDRGRFFALRSCAGCHAVGPRGKSPDTHAPPFATIRLRFDQPRLTQRLAEISRRGHQDMPPIYMTDGEIQDIAAYVQSIKAAPAVPATPRLRQAGGWSVPAEGGG